MAAYRLLDFAKDSAMTIASEVEEVVRDTIERRKQSITLFRENLRRWIPEDELARLGAVFSWEGEKPLVTLLLNESVVIVRLAEWKDNEGKHIRVEKYDCISGGYGRVQMKDTVHFSKIRNAVIRAFAEDEIHERNGEIVPIEGDTQQ